MKEYYRKLVDVVSRFEYGRPREVRFNPKIYDIMVNLHCPRYNKMPIDEDSFMLYGVKVIRDETIQANEFKIDIYGWHRFTVKMEELK